MGIFEDLFAGLTASAAPQPLHVGEVMTLWTAMAAIDECRGMFLLALNHTADPELKRFIEHYLKDLDAPQQRRLQDFMRTEGIPLPPPMADKAKANEKDIPPGAKLLDAEIANMLVVRTLGSIQIFQAGVLQSLRGDVSAMLLAFQAETMRHALALRGIMMRRGWLKVPPYWMVTRAGE